MPIIGSHPAAMPESTRRHALAEVEIFAVTWNRKYGDYLPALRDDLQSALDRVDVLRDEP